MQGEEYRVTNLVPLWYTSHYILQPSIEAGCGWGDSGRIELLVIDRDITLEWHLGGFRYGQTVDRAGLLRRKR